MNGNTNYDLLRQSSLAEGLSEEQCRALSPVLETRELKDGEGLISEGQTDNCLYVITKGKFEVTRNVAGGESVTLALLKEGDFAGELGFLDGRKHTGTLRALGDAVVLTLSRDALESLIESQPQLVYKLMQTIALAVHKILLRMNQQYVAMNNYICGQHGLY